ncbi:hypothetical protein [Peptoniphilus mikwangii]|uniref:hypothetical protein n=1 Tax=Peptoniphilus mikwangii TaxID=1354300 RepID=UPI000415D223|nr:hypothetical protein [Peptoniphilus mikwangii]
MKISKILIYSVLILVMLITCSCYRDDMAIKEANIPNEDISVSIDYASIYKKDIFDDLTDVEIEVILEKMASLVKKEFLSSQSFSLNEKNLKSIGIEKINFDNLDKLKINISSKTLLPFGKLIKAKVYSQLSEKSILKDMSREEFESIIEKLSELATNNAKNGEPFKINDEILENLGFKNLSKEFINKLKTEYLYEN